MNRRSIVISTLTIMIFLLSVVNSNPIYAGWQTDTVGDAADTYFDITKLTISKQSLTITLNENPYYNNSGDTWKFYNIWIDTSMHDTYPDTTTWSTDVFEYVAHFDCRWNGSLWLNNSYIQAFRYYLTADGGTKTNGNFYWDGNNWVGSDPDLNLAVISSTNITFDVDGAIYREQPLGTGYVVQGVANAGSFGSIEDIAPNSGWVDEFDNQCEYPSSSNTELPLSTTGLTFGAAVLGVIGFCYRYKRKK